MKNNNNFNKNVKSVDTNDNKNNNGDDFMKKTNKKAFKKLSKSEGYRLYSEVYELAQELKMDLDEVWTLFEKAKYDFEEAKKLAKDAEARAKDAEAKAKDAEARAKDAEAKAKEGQVTCKEGQDRLEPLYNKVDELTKTVEAYDNMANKFSNEAKGNLNYQKIHGKEIPYAQARVSELENKLRNGEGNTDQILAELQIAKIDLKNKEELYAHAETERQTCTTASKRALKEGNAIRNGELSEAENDLRTINKILAKY